MRGASLHGIILGMHTGHSINGGGPACLLFRGFADSVGCTETLNPLLQSLHLAVANFISNAVSVAATGFVLIPLAIRALDWWVSRRPHDSPRVEVAGDALVIGAYILSIAVFYVIVSLHGAY